MKKFSVAFVAVAALFGLSVWGLTACSSKQDEGLRNLHLEKVEDYLYTVDFTDYEEIYADELSDDFETYFANLFTEKGYVAGGCAGVTNGAIRGRNYDWTYDDMAYFVVKTSANKGRHATLGVSGSIIQLTKDTVESGTWNDAYEMLPFITLDGVNDAGVCCQILVVPTAEGEVTTGTNPDGTDLFALMVTRYVLDYAGSVDEAVALLQDRNIYMPHIEGGMVQEFHWMISDAEKCVVVECVDNKLSVLEDERIVTNFYLTDFDKAQETLPEYPEGIERYNYLVEHFDEGATTEGMMGLLQAINYSNCYDTSVVPFWYSEYCGITEKYGSLNSSNMGDPDLSDGDLSKAGAYQTFIENSIQAFNTGRAKAGESDAWITVFSSVYDTENLTLDICVQEGTEVHSYSL